MACVPSVRTMAGVAKAERRRSVGGDGFSLAESSERRRGEKAAKAPTTLGEKKGHGRPMRRLNLSRHTGDGATTSPGDGDAVGLMVVDRGGWLVGKNVEAGTRLGWP